MEKNITESIMKIKKLIMAVIILALCVGAFVLGWNFRMKTESEKHNLITLDTSVLPEPVEEPEKDDFIQLSEVKMHYQVYGHGKKPLVLIHGNGGSVKSLHEAATYLANDYTVYLTESRCHGQSSDPGEISYSLMAKDIAEFITEMKLDKPYIVGHSDGGMVAIALASEYPEIPGAIVSCGANSVPSGLKFSYTIKVRFRNIFKKTKLNDMILTQPDFNEEYLGRIICPAYIVAGEKDIVKLSDTVYIHEHIKNSDIAIVKGETHGSYMSRNGKKTYVLAKEWLNK